CYQHSSGCTF
nr:immunoglobulin light chain junction region [Macaca mulatta]